MDFKAALVSRNILDVNVVLLNVGLNVAFLPFDLHHYCLQISPSFLTDISLVLSLPPSVLLTGT